MSARSFNIDTVLFCPNLRGQVEILRSAMANAQYISLRDFESMKVLPDAIPDDTFNVALIEGGAKKVTGLAKINYELNNLYIDNDDKTTVIDFPLLDGKDDQNKCQIWNKGLEVNEVDPNCCFKFTVKQVEQILCETSNWCI